MEEIITIGKLLKTAREKHKLSLDDIAGKTKINLNILKSLEEDNIKALPNIAYVRGFVKSYAKAVQVDLETATESLNATYQIQTQEIVKEIKPKEVTPSQEAQQKEEIQESLVSIAQSFFNKNIMIGLAVLVVAIISINSVVDWFADLNFERKEITEVKKEKVTKPIDENIKIEVSTEKKKKELTEETVLKKESENILEMQASKKFAQKIVKEKEEKKEQQKIIEEKKEEVKKEITESKEKEPENGQFPYVRFFPASSEMFTIEESKQTEITEELLPANIKGAYSEGMESVYLVADAGDTWISYQKDGGKIRRYVLRQGRRLFLSGKEILVFLGNYRATKIFHNNKLITVKSTKSGVKSLIFPQKAAKDHILPLFPTYKSKTYGAKEYREKMQDKPNS